MVFRLFSFIKILLGLLFVYSGVMKLIDVDSFILTIYKVKFLTYYHSIIIGYCIIFLEIVFGVFLLANLYSKFALIALIFMLLTFTIFLLSVIIFELEIESCNCFGSFKNTCISYFDIGRNIFLIRINLIALKFEEKHEKA